MKRSTRDIFLKVRRKATYAAGLLLVVMLIYSYFLSVYTDVEISDKYVKCEENICILTIVLRNNTSVLKHGLVSVHYLKYAAPTSNMGPNDGHIMKVFAKEKYNYSLSPNQVKTIREPYLYKVMSPMLTVKVVPNEST